MTSAVVSAFMSRALQLDTLPRDPVHAERTGAAPREHAPSAFEDGTDAARLQLEAEDFAKGHTEKASSLALSSSTARVPVKFLAETMVPGGSGSRCAAGREGGGAGIG